MLVVIFWAMALGLNVVSTQSEIETLLVLPLSADYPDEDASIAKSLDQLILVAVSNFQDFKIASFQDMKVRIGLERAKDALGCDDVQCAAEIGGALNAKRVLVGTLGRLGSAYLLTLRLVDLKTGIGMVTAESEQIPQYANDIKEIVQRLVSQLFGKSAARQHQSRRSTGDVAGQVGELWIQTTPSKVRVFLDAKDYGTTPVRITNLSVGNHQLVLKTDGYITLTKDVLIWPNKTVELEEKLAIQRGTLEVTSAPSGASCLLDGIANGKTPCKFHAVPVGTHKLELRLQGYAVKTTDVRIEFDRTTKGHVHLEPLPVRVVFASVPSNGRLLLNGSSIGDTDYAGTLLPGRHAVKIVKPGYEDFEGEIEVKANKPDVFSFTLVPGLSETEKQRQNVERITRWSLTSLAIVSTGVWAWQALRARSLDKKAENMRVTDSDFEETVNQGETAAKIADGSLIAATVFSAGAAFFWLTMEF